MSTFLHQDDIEELWTITKRFIVLYLALVPFIWLTIVISWLGWLPLIRLDTLLSISLLFLFTSPACFSFYIVSSKKLAPVDPKWEQLNLFLSVVTTIIGTLFLFIWLIT